MKKRLLFIAVFVMFLSGVAAESVSENYFRKVCGLSVYGSFCRYDPSDYRDDNSLRGSRHYAGQVSCSLATSLDKISFLVKPSLRFGYVVTNVDYRMIEYKTGSLYYDLSFDIGVRFNISKKICFEFYPFGLGWGFFEKPFNVNIYVGGEIRVYGFTVGVGCRLYMPSPKFSMIVIPVYVGYSFGF